MNKSGIRPSNGNMHGDKHVEPQPERFLWEVHMWRRHQHMAEIPFLRLFSGANRAAQVQHAIGAAPRKSSAKA